MKVTYEETAKLMLADSYKERFIAEYYQLRIRIDRLNKFLIKYYVSEDKPKTPFGVYTMQMKAMQEYRNILEARAAIEGIDIEEEDYTYGYGLGRL